MATVPWSVQSGGQTTAPLYTDVAYCRREVRTSV